MTPNQSVLYTQLRGALTQAAGLTVIVPKAVFSSLDGDTTPVPDTAMTREVLLGTSTMMVCF